MASELLLSGMFVFVTYLLLLVSDATVVLDVNTTAGESTILPCILMITSPTGLKNLRFYWQDEKKHVLYSFNEGKEIPQHVNELYQDRITAFPQDMIRGNISVKVKNLTLEDNQNVFQVFAAVFDSVTRRYSLEHRQICQITLHVAVPYKSVSLAVNEETATAVCTTTQRGFPEPLVSWSLQHLSDNSQHFLDPRDVHTTAVQDRQDHLYSLSSTIDIPGGRYRSVTCFIHNPTLNVTGSATHVLNKGEAERSLPGWAFHWLFTGFPLLSLMSSY